MAVPCHEKVYARLPAGSKSPAGQGARLNEDQSDRCESGLACPRCERYRGRAWPGRASRARGDETS